MIHKLRASPRPLDGYALKGSSSVHSAVSDYYRIDYLNGGSTTAFNRLRLNGIRHPDKGSLLNKHSVTLHGSGNNTHRSRRLFDRAGVKLVAVRAHDYDMVHQILGLNTINPRKLVGSLIYANHVMSGSVAQSPHTIFQSHKEWSANMESGPGKGRGRIQSAFHRLENRANRAIKTINNYLP